MWPRLHLCCVRNTFFCVYNASHYCVIGHMVGNKYSAFNAVLYIFVFFANGVFFFIFFFLLYVRILNFELTWEWSGLVTPHIKGAICMDIWRKHCHGASSSWSGLLAAQWTEMTSLHLLQLAEVSCYSDDMLPLICFEYDFDRTAQSFLADKLWGPYKMLVINFVS